MQNATNTPNTAKKYASGPVFAHRFEFNNFMGNNEVLGNMPIQVPV